ncbi:hypothetical protein [Bradyrhizobium sp. Leo121]|uniref:hypothetical protein n=1 Tax=Bradyrhizobium sp. Leo121 TaxID=1571195 RepID=UPI001FE1F675|nr:hypothetical protein [Bradyrhizobium sp. Leo121]
MRNLEFSHDEPPVPVFNLPNGAERGRSRAQFNNDDRLSRSFSPPFVLDQTIRIDRAPYDGTGRGGISPPRAQNLALDQIVRFQIFDKERMRHFIFVCPNTHLNVQHSLDEDDNTDQNEFTAVSCPACTRLHFLSRKTGQLLGADSTPKS